jgi:UDP-N-acetylglucosamine 2-epimerase (non-hydrolysing)
MGTRPEVIKLAPVIRELDARKDRARSLVCVTGQHREMLWQMLTFFSLNPDVDLNLMREGQSLTQLTSGILGGVQIVLDRFKPDWVVVQGDTCTAMAASLAAFYSRTKVAHIEAGLRTYDKTAPFPEEINRRITGMIADLHFAPTTIARDALRSEGHAAESIVVTGNTVIDSLFWVRDRVRRGLVRKPDFLARLALDQRLVLVTAHRRENFDRGMEEICTALGELVGRHDDIVIVCPVHPNPRVRQPVTRILGNTQRICLTDPLEYGHLVCALDAAYLVITDSGGIQEEASALGRPIVIMRDSTERPEVLLDGNAVLAGSSAQRIVDCADIILSDSNAHRRMSRPSTSYGNGQASTLIVQRLVHG